MNLETKYLIRWGIPGWVFIMLLGFLLLIYNPSYINIFKSKDTLGLVGALISASFIGVPIGYLCHQLYFLKNWLGKKRPYDVGVRLVSDQSEIKKFGWDKDAKADYFMFEYEWQRQLVHLPDSKREYITERYRHLLSTIHGLGALRASLTISLAVNFYFLVISIWKSDPLVSVKFSIFLLLTACMRFTVGKGFLYYSKNLNYFQANFLNAFHKGEFKQETPK